MAKEILVETAIKDGRSVIEALDKEGILISSAFWFYLSSECVWRLKLASSHPDFSEAKNILQGYQRIADCLRNIQAPSLSIADVEIISVKDPLILALKKAFKASGSGGIRLQHTLVNTIYFEDAYIYRI